ncbi:hypothetical protein JNJ66_02765 [Candidatus Saccharibacteria bacterium]|nr:hypothetical protein [Candidatus Saccharibacteria bacterium]
MTKSAFINEIATAFSWTSALASRQYAAPDTFLQKLLYALSYDQGAIVEQEQHADKLKRADDRNTARLPKHAVHRGRPLDMRR